MVANALGLFGFRFSGEGRNLGTKEEYLAEVK